MGVVQRQSIKQSIVSWTGMLVGALNLFFIYPLTLNSEQIGILQFVIRASSFFVPFALLGSHIVAIRYYPLFSDGRTDKRGFLGWLLKISAISTFILLLLLGLFRHSIASMYEGKSEYFMAFLPYIVPLIALMSFAYLLVVYASNFQRIVVPAIYWNLLSKCTIPVLCISFAWGYITFSHIFDGLLITYLGILVGVIAYTIWLKQWFVKAAHTDIPKQEMRNVWQFYAYSSVFGVSLTILTQVDALFVGSLINLSSVAIFSVGFFLAEAIDTPRKAILSVSGPLVAKHLANNEIKETETLYQQVSINQLIAGGWLLLGIWVCSDALFSIMPKGDTFRDARLVILILGFARLFDMAGSLNYEIINYSKHYRILLPLTVSVAVMTMLLNYLLIPTYGIYGAAAATALSVLLYNIIKVAYIYKVLHIQPFTAASIKWFFLFIVLLFSSALLKSGAMPWFDFLWKGALATILYAIGVYALALSPQINSFIAKRLHRG